MKLLVLSHAYPPTISGVSVVAQKLGREMVMRGHETTVVTASERYRPYRSQDQGVDIIRVRSIRNPFWVEGPLPVMRGEALWEIVQEVKPDLIHTHDSGLLSWPLFSIEQQCDLPHVLTCHYIPRFVTNYINLGEAVAQFAELLAWRYSVRMMDHFDHITFPTATQANAFLGHGMRQPWTVISNGVDTARYTPSNISDPDVQHHYRLPPGPRILFVGRLAKDKRIELLIGAMPRVWEAVRGRLVIVGRGDNQATLQELTRNLGVEHCVRFLGFVPEVDLPAIYRSSDLFTIASECEVQSIPTIQAAACGLPIVGVRAGALPELIQSEHNGFLVSPGDADEISEAIIRILKAADLAQAMGEASKVIGLRHSESTTYDAFEALYRQVIQAEAKFVSSTESGSEKTSTPAALIQREP